MTMITGDQIAVYRLKVLRQALRLEILGMHRRGRSVYSIIKQEFHLTGSKESILKQIEKIIADQEA